MALLVALVAMVLLGALLMALPWRIGAESRAAMEQLALNLFGLVIAGVTTLFVQRKLYQRRRRTHLHDDAREAAGLPMGRSARAPKPETKET